jgi:hypothetical protein
MLEEIDRLLRARQKLLAWWERFQNAKNADPEVKAKIAIDESQVEAFFGSNNKITTENMSQSGVLSSAVADYVCEHADVIVKVAYERALAEINSKLAESKVELQKLLESF